MHTLTSECANAFLEKIMDAKKVKRFSQNGDI